MDSITQTEKLVIGSVLIDNECISRIYGVLLPVHFTNKGLKRIYSAMLNLHNNNKPIELLMIANEVEDETYTHEIIGQAVKQCIDITTTSVNIMQYVDLMINNYKLNKLREISEIKANTSVNDVDSCIADKINQLTNLQYSKTDNNKHIKDIISINKHKYFNENYKPKRLYLGFKKLDELLGGIEAGDLITIGARPSVGKSALVSQIILNVSKRNKKVVFYNLEMSETQIYERLLAHETGISLNKIRNSTIYRPEEKTVFNKANDEISELPIIVNACGSKTVSEIKNECKFNNNLELIVIDYLQLLHSEKTYNNRTVEIGVISRTLKAMAMELKVPVIVLSQLNRASEGRQDKEPTMADLRESGDIEQDSNGIILIWKCDEENESHRGIKVEKNRQGRIGKLIMDFDGAKMKFVETDIDLTKKKSKKRSYGFTSVTDEELPFND